MYGLERKSFRQYIGAVVEACCVVKADTIAGPILSGAAIATAAFTYATYKRKKYPTTLVYLPNKGYKKRKHYDEMQVVGKYLPDQPRVFLVDDLLGDGTTLTLMVNLLSQEEMHYPPIKPIVVGLMVDANRGKDTDYLLSLCGSTFGEVPRFFVWTWDRELEYDPHTSLFNSD